MTVTREPLDEREKEDVEALLQIFLEGECYAFAVAMQQLTGFEMVALTTPEHLTRHAAVRDPEGCLYDARGRVPEEEFGKPFYVSPPYTLRVVSLGELKLIRPIPEHAISHAAAMIELMWPELVRVPTDITCKMRRFLEDLETLSRKHRIWIHGQYPGALPRLSRTRGDEVGYSWRTSVFGSAHVFTTALQPKKR